MLVELHILQNFAPACLNRDDTNAPKVCDFGGRPRARISSQCIKRSVRRSDIFRSTVGENIALRTKRLLGLLKQALERDGITADNMETCLSDFIAELYCKMEKSGNATSVALYLSQREIEAIIEALKQNWSDFVDDSKKAAKKVATDLEKTIRDAYAADIALFGRMMAEKPTFNIDAASQVAHAISTNEISQEMDFFTAVDDLLPSGETGAGMMGIIEYNSSCFYRYSNVDLRQLMVNLRKDEELARKTLEGFLRASILAIPTGKQTSMAAQNPPSFIMTTVRENGFRCSLANAFVKPVLPDHKQDLIEKSVVALDEYWAQTQRAFGSDGLKKVIVCQIGVDALDNLKASQVDNIDSLVESVMGSAELDKQELEK